MSYPPEDEEENEYLDREEARYNQNEESLDRQCYENSWHHAFETASELVKMGIHNNEVNAAEKKELQRKAIKFVGEWLEAYRDATKKDEF
jgi:hypothetical protein